MKLCPQCEFIYEDDQCFCDMDGKELVHNPAPVIQANVADPSSPTSKPAAGRRSIGLAVAVIFGVVLTALGSAVYFARTEQAASGVAVSNQSPDRSAGQSSAQSTSEATGAQPSPGGVIATQTPDASSVLAAQSAEQSSAQTDASSPPSTASSSLAHARLAANPVSTKAPVSNRGSVIVRLNNGTSIKADEAWETKEGIWYRQAGLVTFLNRGRVRAIGRAALPPAPSKSGTSNVQEKKRNAEKTAARNQLRLPRLEPADTKKPSRVASFLKATGRILKRPFKL